MTELYGYHHLAILCKDINASLHFYHDLLGLPISRIVRGEEKDSYYVKMPDGVEIQFLDLKGKQIPVDPRPENRSGGHHFGFLVDDVEYYWNLLRNEGYQVRIPYCHYDKYSHYTCGFNDPDGIMVEFIVPYYMLVDKALPDVPAKYK